MSTDSNPSTPTPSATAEAQQLDAEAFKPEPLNASTPGNESADLQEAIRQAAYRRAEQRNFEGGHEVEDWLAAEEEVMKGTASAAP